MIRNDDFIGVKIKATIAKMIGSMSQKYGGSVSDGVTVAGGLLSKARGPDAFWSTAWGSPYTWTFTAASSIYDKGSTAARGFFPWFVGVGRFISVTNSGHSVLPTPFRPFHLNNVLITPNIVKNLIFIRQFVRDNSCTVEFDPFGFSVKDFITRRVLLRCDSTGDLYLLTKPSTIPYAFLISQYTWH
nr:ribonuclease H-like domain-containing protein [Tanacetum cinerariifolium]